MISNDNVTFTIRQFSLVLRLRMFGERLVSYLPLSHVAAQLLDIFCAINVGATVYFAQPDALKGSLTTSLKEVRPTLFFGVPRVWEKIEEALKKAISGMTGTKLKLVNWSRKLASMKIKTAYNQSSMSSSPATFPYKVAKRFVLRKIHSQLGLDKSRAFLSGAAPIRADTVEFFASVGLPLCEIYGMSETSGPHTFGLAKCNRISSAGLQGVHNRSKLCNQDKTDGSGELCVYGRHVFMGYMNSEAKTRETFDEDDWLHTGDIAKIEDGFLFITGRLKELIITAGGENIAPIPIEDNVKTELPNLVSNCMLIGDKRKYLTLLVTLHVSSSNRVDRPLYSVVIFCCFLKVQCGPEHNATH